MTEPDDIVLLREFAATESESAFATLVSRHINLVYSTALRNVGNAHAAEEITQAVFIILARKAKAISGKTILSGWLYQTTRLTAANFLRGEIRRQKREQEAYMQSTLNEPDETIWPQIAPLLDGALEKLGERDRNAIVLRFFENKNLREVGAALGASEDAAKMRVNRALEKLRKIFTRRGVTFSAAAIAGAISANSVHAAPMGLAKTISAVVIAKGAAVGGSTLALVKGALKLMAWTKMKIAIVASACVLLAAGTTTVVVKHTIESNSVDDSYFDLNSNFEKMRQAPPLLVVRPTHFPQDNPVSVTSNFGGKGIKMVGRAVPFESLLQSAYGSPTNYDAWPGMRMILLANLPTNKFDFLVTVPDCRIRFQAKLKKQFGIIGRREIRDAGVFLLRLKTAGAAGLKQSANISASDLTHQDHYTFGPDKYIVGNHPFSEFTGFLENAILQKPVINQTGFTGRYDINLKWDAKEADWKHPNYDGLKQALIGQLGLELVPTNMPIEMLVVEKAN